MFFCNLHNFVNFDYIIVCNIIGTKQYLEKRSNARAKNVHKVP